VMNSDFV